MYSVKEFLNREPAVISAAIIDVVGFLEIVDAISLTSDAMAGVGMAVTSVLSLFYIRSKTVTKDFLESRGVEVPS